MERFFQCCHCFIVYLQRFIVNNSWSVVVFPHLWAHSRTNRSPERNHNQNELIFLDSKIIDISGDSWHLDGFFVPFLRRYDRITLNYAFHECPQTILVFSQPSPWNICLSTKTLKKSIEIHSYLFAHHRRNKNIWSTESSNRASIRT